MYAPAPQSMQAVFAQVVFALVVMPVHVECLPATQFLDALMQAPRPTASTEAYCDVASDTANAHGVRWWPCPSPLSTCRQRN
jgi:hypothetical protein